MKVIFVLAVFCLLLTGCDYTYDYTYEITNFTNEVITVKTVKRNNSWSLYIKDSIFEIKPNETKIIITDDGGICGRNYTPPCEYKSTDSIPPSYIKFDILVGENILSKKFRLFEYWTYKTDERSGTYNLQINNSLLTE
ncbi:hypothetical protein G7050_06870 [Dysgonomonas sp. HDW5A]|uniref:hypothetical protein n=1 Tax=Dysgonomonas sp. HDW5A TaxID=2714926 RepID=UPI00140B6828|nr:hypothetical protein [Dysgonomonas sp. HDW5A]QIK59566.1 hypothetical protein G7050_06870 [Dysgonomonas sp. HDW5A]